MFYNTKTFFCVERKMQFLHEEVQQTMQQSDTTYETESNATYETESKSTCKTNLCTVHNFIFTATLDFSFVKSLVLDSVSVLEDEKCGFCATCAFGFLFDFEDENNFLGVLVSDFDFFCVFEVKNGNFSFLNEWKKLDEKICFCTSNVGGLNDVGGTDKLGGLNEVGDGSASNVGSFVVVKPKKKNFVQFKIASSSPIHIACQNYLFHEKVGVNYVYCFRKAFNKCGKIYSRGKIDSREKTHKNCKTLKFGKIDSRVCDATFPQLKNPVMNENNENAWNAYQNARDCYLAGDIKNARSYIFTAASELSENLALLELYALIQKEVSLVEFNRSIVLIESNIKHAPYGKDYRSEAQNLIERLKSGKSELKFSLDNRAIFPLENPLVPVKMQRYN